MSYKALYRTYRPSTFDEVAGQQHIVRTLKNALNENKIAHAYLFCGPRGTGKTTMARLFAKALNCSQSFGDICNECENCKAINEGNHPDVIELDAASNRGIEDIRSLISKVKYAPILGRYKVYIIDEVHMMTNEAFNALLKTLEEPPENVVFILATTEPYKLMPTILSRCQRYDFTKVSDQDIKTRLEKVCKEESITIEDKALDELITLADGGMRDALSMLDQASAYTSNNIKESDIEALYGLSSIGEKVALLDALNKADVVKVNSFIEELVNHGTDIKRLTSDLIEVLKDVLIYQSTKDTKLLKYLNAEDLNTLSISSYKVNKMIDILLSALSQYRLVSNIKSLFEISLLKIASLSSISEDNVIVKEVVKEVIKEVPTSAPISANTSVDDVLKHIEKPAVETVTPPVQEERIIRPSLFTPKEEVVKPVEEINFAQTELFSSDLFKDVSPLEENGTKIEFNSDDIINICVQAKKDSKLALKDSWDKLNDLIPNPIMGKYASVLKMCEPGIVCKDAIVLISRFEQATKKINFKENQLGMSRLLEYISASKCIVVALSNLEYLQITKRFSDLSQINRLPKPQPINIDVTNNKVTPTEEIAKELKGE